MVQRLMALAEKPVLAYKRLAHIGAGRHSVRQSERQGMAQQRLREVMEEDRSGPGRGRISRVGSHYILPPPGPNFPT